jgi:hypothetical protein
MRQPHNREPEPLIKETQLRLDDRIEDTGGFSGDAT